MVEDKCIEDEFLWAEEIVEDGHERETICFFYKSTFDSDIKAIKKYEKKVKVMFIAHFGESKGRKMGVKMFFA